MMIIVDLVRPNHNATNIALEWVIRVMRRRLLILLGLLRKHYAFVSQLFYTLHEAVNPLLAFLQSFVQFFIDEDVILV